ncbi:MAG TPA: hypothetical protein QGF05_09155 [Dehalococcoidia bacterium]|nr:hypothetical protein [Dehalococcoidia bacterium]
MIMEGDAPALDSAGRPRFVMAVIPQTAVDILETWHTLGMRGTGSHDVKVEDLFVSHMHAPMVSREAARHPAFEGPLYRFGIALAGPMNASIVTGVARAVVEDGTELALSKTGTYMAPRLPIETPCSGGWRERRPVSMPPGRCRTTRPSRRRSIWTSTRRYRRHIGSIASSRGVTRSKLASRRSTLVQRVVGTSGVGVEGRFQQYFRDVHTINQNAIGSEGRFGTAGQLLRGRTPDMPLWEPAES